MDYKATLMALVLVSSALAGCTGDPDGGGGDEIDSDALQDLFDEHFQDFLNNTTITVNNHYYNNTTYVTDDGDYSSTTNVEYNNTTINEGDESSTNNYNNQTDNDYSSSSLNYSINGSGDGSGSVVQAFRVVWNPDDRYEITDYGARDLVLNGTVQVAGWSGSEMSYQYNGHLIKLNLTCEEFVNAYLDTNYEDWANWIFADYGGSWSQAQQLGQSIRSDINEVYSAATDGYCWEDNYDIPGYQSSYERDYQYTTVVEIPLSAGQALDFMYIPNIHNITLDCDGGHSSSSSNGTMYGLLGGFDDCTVRLNAEIQVWWEYDQTNVANGTGPSLETPPWFDGPYWYDFDLYRTSSTDYTGVRISTPTDFLVYFTMHFVQVYEHDLE